MTSRVTVAGEALPALLERLGTGADPRVVEIRPAPADWASMKPMLFAARDRVALPQFVGYPACAIGIEYRQLPTTERLRFAHPPCARCAVRAACSQPLTWNDELQPFRGGPPLELWHAYHERLAAVLGMPRDPLLDDVVSEHLQAVRATANPLTLEPSVVVRDGLEPAVRLAIFHGLLPRDVALARAATHASLEGFRRMQLRAAGRFDERLLDVLRAHAPFRAPVGVEATANRLLFKAYIELSDDSPERRHDFVRDLVGESELPWEDVMLLGAVTDGASLVSLKAYVRHDPTVRFRDLMPLSPSDPIVLRSGGQAFAVVDVLDAKPPKWDLSVRRNFLSGMCVASALGFVGRARTSVEQLLRHHDFRSDCIAVGLREGATTLYVELG